MDVFSRREFLERSAILSAAAAALGTDAAAQEKPARTRVGAANDRLRNELESLGVEVTDTREGTTWRVR